MKTEGEDRLGHEGHLICAYPYIPSFHQWVDEATMSNYEKRGRENETPRRVL